MSVGLDYPDTLLPISGIRLSTVKAGLYNTDRYDVALIEISEGSTVAAVFTRNRFCAAPVQIAKQNLVNSSPRYCLINAGNANAGNGDKGVEDARKTCEALAGLVACESDEIIPFSTGVIGEPFPVAKIEKVLPDLKDSLSHDAWIDVAEAIMTTDTIPKAISEKMVIGDMEINITGIAKGSGMIKPNMATMLSFIATDAKINEKTLKQLIHESVDKSFNRISVDGDTSTNDACVLIATGKASKEIINSSADENYQIFKQGLDKVCLRLAQAIVRDGEGATKFVEIDVCNAKSQEDCLNIASKVAESPLVKTAFTASDPNWGRILAAVGNANIDSLQIDKICIYLDELCIVNNGQRSESYTEESGKKIMLKDEIKITIDLNCGTHSEKIWTTDLSHEYVTINAEYRT